MLTRRSLLRRASRSALGFGATSAGFGFCAQTPAVAISGFPRPDQRDPTALDDRTQGNVVGRLWLNAKSGRLFRASDVTPNGAVWTDEGTPPRYPGDRGTWNALIGTKPLTSAYARGTKPFVDVYAVGMDLQPAGPHTINFVDGAIDTARIRALQGANPATASMAEDAMCVQKLLLVTRWYDQSGNEHHYEQSAPYFMPALWLTNGTADGTGEDVVCIAFSRAPAVPNHPRCDRHLVSTKGNLGTRSTTIYAVCQPHEASNDQSEGILFATSLDRNGIDINTSSIDWIGQPLPYRNGIARWRLTNLEAAVNVPTVRCSTSPAVLSISLGGGGVEFAANDEVAHTNALPDARGAGSVIGAGYRSWNAGNPEAAEGGRGFYGTVDAILVRAGTDAPDATRSVRARLHRAYAVIPQAANDTVVVEGDSGTVCWGSVFPLVPYKSAGQFQLADIGVDGYGLNWMNQRRLSRACRYVQLGRVGCGCSIR